MATETTKHLLDFAELSVEDRDKVVADCQTLKKGAMAVRQEYDRSIIQNAAFLAGDQYTEFVKDAWKYTNDRRIPIETPGSTIKIVANKVLGLCWQQMSYLMQNFPEEAAVAPDSSQEGAMRAEIASDVLRARYQLDNEQQQRQFDLMWLFVAGRIWIITYWNSDAAYQGFGGEEVRGAGDLKRVTLNPFKTYQSPYVDSTGEMPWLILSDCLPVATIKDMFPRSADKIVAMEVAESVGQMDSLLQAAVQGRSQPPRRKDAAILDRLYHTPTKDYPEGSLITWCGNELVDRVSLPNGKWCFVNVDWTPIPGANYPLAYIQPMIQPQRQLNFTLSQIAELAKRNLRGDIIYKGQLPSEELQPVTDWYDETTGAKRIRLAPGTEDFQFVTYDLNPRNGQYVVEAMGDILLDVGNLHDQSMGKQTAADVTATTTLALKESDSAGTSLHRDMIAKAYCKVGEQKLFVLSKHVVMPRPMTSKGQDGQPQEFLMAGSDIEGVNEVTVKPTPMMTDAQRRETIDRIFTSRILGPYENLDPSMPMFWEALAAGARQVLSTGIQGMERLVKDRIAPFKSIEELEDFVTGIRVEGIKLIMNPPQPMPQPGIPGQQQMALPAPGVQQ
jgi:hypothetical protein